MAAGSIILTKGSDPTTPDTGKSRLYVGSDGVLRWKDESGTVRVATSSGDLSVYELLSNKDTTVTLGTSDTKYPSQKAVKTYVDALLAASDAMVFKGSINASANPNYPAADAGHLYMISVAGKIGGASGTTVEAGDMIVCLVDATAAGTQAAVGANWDVIQTNIVGAVSGPAASTDANIPTFSGATGKIIQDSGKAHSTDGTLASNSDAKVPTEKAVKLYADTGLALKQNSLGFTAENVANKDVDGTLAANSDTKYASQKAAKTYIDTKDGLLIPKSLGTTKGDQIGFTASGTPVRHAIGANDTFQIADSAQADGWKWSGLPQSIIDAIMPWGIERTAAAIPDSNTGFGAAASLYTQFYDVYRVSSGSINDKIGWNLNLAAGTWELTVMGRKSANSGILTAYVDTVTTGQTADFYNGSDLDGSAVTLSTFTVAASGKHLLELRMATKNILSGAYYLLLNGISLRRTA